MKTQWNGCCGAHIAVSHMAAWNTSHDRRCGHAGDAIAFGELGPQAAWKVHRNIRFGQSFIGNWIPCLRRPLSGPSGSDWLTHVLPMAFSCLLTRHCISLAAICTNSVSNVRAEETTMTTASPRRNFISLAAICTNSATKVRSPGTTMTTASARHDPSNAERSSRLKPNSCVNTRPNFKHRIVWSYLEHRACQTFCMLSTGQASRSGS